MANTLLNYAVPFSQVTSLPPPTFGYLHTLAVAVLHDTPATPPDTTLVTDPADLVALTAHSDELMGAFDGGLNSIYLVRVNDSAELITAIAGKESEFYTLFIHQSIVIADAVAAHATWQGVTGTVSSSVADIEHATLDRFCLFGSLGVTSAYNPLLAFGSLLSAAFWRNQQYIPTTDETGTIPDVGICEQLFDARISFFLQDEENGNRLGFFVAGGKSITTPYIAKEVEQTMQFRMTNYLASAQPFNVVVERGRLEQIADKTLVEYQEQGYLDPDMPNDVRIIKTAEAYVVAGTLVTSPSVALWRVKMDAYQTQG